MKPRFLDHIVIFVKSVKKTEAFYVKFLGKPDHQDKYSITYKIGDTKIFFASPYRKPQKIFDKEEIGLNHLAFGVRKLPELKSLEWTLKKGRVKNSGVKIDRYGKKPFIWFDDPDGIRLEFYLRTK